MGSGCDSFADLRKMQVHRFAIAGWQDQGCALAFLGADRAENVGGSRTLIARHAGGGCRALPVRGRGLRHKWRTVAADVGIDELHAHVMLGHAPKNISESYITLLMLAQAATSPSSARYRSGSSGYSGQILPALACGRTGAPVSTR